MKSFHLFALALFTPLVLVGCKSFSSDSSPAEAAFVRSELGAMSNTTEWGDFYMGGQPTAEELELASKRGVTRVINIRTEPEIEALDFNEVAVCAELGMEYIHVPINWDSLTDEKFDFLLQVLSMETPGKTLFHCGSGNRVSVFVAAHRVIEANVSYEDALKDARTAGMKPTSRPVLDGQLVRLTKAE